MQLDPSRPRYTLYTDASCVGWGAILCDHAGRVYSTGGAWTCSSTEIAAGEATAIRLAVRDFSEVLAATQGHLGIRCDNTSVVAAIVTGNTRSAPVAPIVDDIVSELQLLGWTVDVKYLKSSVNPADPISRGRELDVPAIRGAMEYERQGAGGEGVASHVLPSRYVHNG